MLRPIIFASFGATILFASHAHAAMLATAIEAEIVGKTLNWKGPKGLTGKAKYSRNGSAKTWEMSGKLERDTGTWRIKSNQLCISWKIIRSGTERCLSISKTGNNQYKMSNGVVFTTR